MPEPTPDQEPLAEPAAALVAETEYSPPFVFDEARLFELYLEQRRGLIQGGREAYQRFNQTIVALSGGSIVLSLTFMKDIGLTPASLPWLFASWACFVIATLCAFVSLLTSGESDRERLVQVERLVNTGESDEAKANRLGRATQRLNYFALTFCILGVLLIITFATSNLLDSGASKWTQTTPTQATARAAPALTPAAPRKATPASQAPVKSPR